MSRLSSSGAPQKVIGRNVCLVNFACLIVAVVLENVRCKYLVQIRVWLIYPILTARGYKRMWGLIVDSAPENIFYIYFR
jgi:hypothetical protein